MGKVADPGFALGWQGLESQGPPGRIRVTLDEDSLLILDHRGNGLVAGVQPSPASTAEGVVHVQAKLGEWPVGDGLDHTGQAGFGGGVELAFAHAGVFEAVVAGLPGLGSVEDDHTDVAHIAEVVEAAGEDIRVHGAGG